MIILILIKYLEEVLNFLRMLLVRSQKGGVLEQFDYFKLFA